MSKQSFWIVCVFGLVTAVLFASGCLSADLGNMKR